MQHRQSLDLLFFFLLLIPANTVAFFTTVSQLYSQILKAMTTEIHMIQQFVSSFSFR
jgi:hypothetical protein